MDQSGSIFPWRGEPAWTDAVG